MDYQQEPREYFGGSMINMSMADFVKEHHHLIDVLKHGSRKAQTAEANSQANELKSRGGRGIVLSCNEENIEREGGSKSSGYIRRLLVEEKKSKNGIFNYSKIKKPSKWLQTKYKNKHDVSDVAKENKARRDREYTEERYIRPYRKTIANIKYYSQPENWNFLTTKERASLYQKIYDLDYYQKQVPEVGANPYPNADSLPYVEMRRAYKMWLKKNNLSDKN